MDPNNISYNLQESYDDEAAALEDCWFFGNLLQTRSKSSRMLRSFSDPCSSSSSFPGKSYDETYEAIKKTNPTATRERRSNIIRKTSSSSSARKNLARAPSLPTSLERDRDFHDDEEAEFSMGKLIRQASLNYSDTRPPRTKRNAATATATASASAKSSSLTRQKSRLKPEMESVVRDEVKTSAQRSLMKDFDIEQELQGFKELGIFHSDDKLELSSINAVTTTVSVERRGAPPVPRWGGKRSTEDVKAQIKFWARAVASNVRQEC